MGYTEPLEEVFFCVVKLSQVEKKINSLLTAVLCMLSIWLNSAQEDLKWRISSECYKHYSVRHWIVELENNKLTASHLRSQIDHFEIRSEQIYLI